MLRIVDVILDLIRDVAPIEASIRGAMRSLLGSSGTLSTARRSTRPRAAISAAGGARIITRSR